MQTGQFHALHHRHKKGKNDLMVKLIDRSAYLMGAITVAVNVPQLIAVWTSPDINGVSLVSWTGFFLGSGFWLFYGIIHKEKPIITINSMLLCVQGLIVLGIIRHGNAF